MYREAHAFLESLTAPMLFKAIATYRQLDRRGQLLQLYPTYQVPHSHVYFEPRRPGELWGRLLLAIVYEQETKRKLDQKRLGGVDGAIEKTFVALGLECLDLHDSKRVELRREVNRHFWEGARAKREVSFFRRNVELALAVKQRANYSCVACGFRGTEQYGGNGQCCIEAHHLRAFGDWAAEEQVEGNLNCLDDLAALCANCHRAIHSRSPALSLDELKQLLADSR